MKFKKEHSFRKIGISTLYGFIALGSVLTVCKMKKESEVVNAAITTSKTTLGHLFSYNKNRHEAVVLKRNQSR